MDPLKVNFIVDSQGKKTHAVLPIGLYKEFLALKELLSPKILPTGNEIYTLAVKNLTAKGYPLGDRSRPYFMILKGSQASLNIVSSLPENIKSYRDKMILDDVLIEDHENNCLYFTKDLKVPSASFAAALIAGNVRNGLDVWISREGFSLKKSGFGLNNARSHR